MRLLLSCAALNCWGQPEFGPSMTPLMPSPQSSLLSSATRAWGQPCPTVSGAGAGAAAQGQDPSRADRVHPLAHHHGAAPSSQIPFETLPTPKMLPHNPLAVPSPTPGPHSVWVFNDRWIATYVVRGSRCSSHGMSLASLCLPPGHSASYVHPQCHSAPPRTGRGAL